MSCTRYTTNCSDTCVRGSTYDKDHECANGSCDYVINLMLVDENKKDGLAKMPEGGLLSEKYRGMNTQQVFDLLYKEKEEQGAKVVLLRSAVAKGLTNTIGKAHKNCR